MRHRHNELQEICSKAKGKPEKKYSERLKHLSVDDGRE